MPKLLVTYGLQSYFSNNATDLSTDLFLCGKGEWCVIWDLVLGFHVQKSDSLEAIRCHQALPLAMASKVADNSPIDVNRLCKFTNNNEGKIPWNMEEEFRMHWLD